VTAALTAGTALAEDLVGDHGEGIFAMAINHHVAIMAVNHPGFIII